MSTLDVCKDCRLHETASQVVPGRGALDAEILFLGEAPGYNEDKEGRPFIGRAGRVFDQMLGDLGIKREDVYVTNIVKHWPGRGNRDPLPDEIAACSKWLDAEIKSIRPKLIVCLGAFAAGQYFPDKAKMGAFRVLADKTVIVKVFHPAFFLRGHRPAVKQQILTGIRVGVSIYKELLK